MSDQSKSTERRDLYSGRVKEMARGTLAEVMAWDVFKWVVLALLVANVLLIAGLYRGVRSDIAAMTQDRGTQTTDLANVRASFTKDMSDMRAALAKDIADTKTGLTQTVSDLRAAVSEEAAKTDAKLDSLTGSTQQPQKPRQRR
jgi:hypothetical protein